MLTAVPFGFGPTAALQVLLDRLALEFDGEIELATCQAVNPVLDFPANCTQLLTENEISDALDCADGSNRLIINFGDLNFPSLFRSKSPQLFVDCVGWLTPRYTDRLFRQASGEVHHLIEYFPLIDAGKLPPQSRLVKPSVLEFKSNMAPSHNKVLISLGGGCLPGQTKRCSDVLAPLIERASSLLLQNGIKLDVTIVGLPPSIASATQPIHEHRSKREHLILLSESSTVVCVPGLYTVFESLCRERTVILLPPTNFTQLVQFNWYRHNGLVFSGLDWMELFELPYSPEEVMSLEDEIRFSQRLSAFYSRPEALALASKRLADAMHAPPESLEAHAAARERLLSEYIRAPLPSVYDVARELIRNA